MELVVTTKKLVDLDESKNRVLLEHIAEKYTIARKDVEKGEPFVKEWYPKDEKFRKQKLGSIFNCKQLEDTEVLCRVMKFDRISSYQVEGYFANIAKLKFLQLQDYLMFPKGIHIEGENEINVLVP